MNILYKLNNKKKKAIALIAITISIFVLIVGSWIIYFLYILGILFIAINIACKKKIYFIADNLFSTIDRNYDYLIIGRNCNIADIIPDSNKYLCITTPVCSLFASILLVQRLYSLINEKTGKIIVILDNTELEKKNVTVLDLPYIHEITMKNMNFRYTLAKKYFPLLFEPINVFKFLFSKSKRDTYEATCPSKELATFCYSRNIILQFKYLK